jgi:hypothetical protein
MLNQSNRNPVGFVVVYKKDGVVMEFQRTAKQQPKIHAHMQTAINAVKRLKDEVMVGHQPNGEWCAMTTIRLAEIHKRGWEKARV